MIRINLAPERGRRRRRIGIGLNFSLPSFNLGWLFGIVYLVALVGIGGYWWTLKLSEDRLRSEIAAAKREIDTLRAQIGQENKMKEMAAELKKRIGVIETLTKNQGRSILLVDAFASAVPADLWITGIEDKNAALKISGAALSPVAVSNFMTNLRRSGKFKDVDIVISRQDLAKPNPQVTFEVTCRFEG
ncbi:MAG TPA: PilN domain-containing protein [Methylomirabilota bacterium]|jgi:Tfp pilus assembly protein PilN